MARADDGIAHVGLYALKPALRARVRAMTSERNGDDETIYTVVLNREEQYSIWRVDRELPLGWSEAGKRGTKSECLDHINEVWTDMRPRSLREATVRG
jgi:MbtH protein